MPFKEKCPVCRLGWRVRPDVKTCSRQCSKEWSNWSPEQRAKATTVIASDAPFNLEEVKKELSAVYEGLKKEESTRDPYPDPLAEEDPAASHIFKILGG